jgi:hypothetical protein
LIVVYVAALVPAPPEAQAASGIRGEAWCGSQELEAESGKLKPEAGSWKLEAGSYGKPFLCQIREQTREVHFFRSR